MNYVQLDNDFKTHIVLTGYMSPSNDRYVSVLSLLCLEQHINSDFKRCVAYYSFNYKLHYKFSE